MGDSITQKIFETTDLASICESSISAPTYAVSKMNKDMLDKWIAECFVMKMAADGTTPLVPPVFVPIVLQMSSTNESGETIVLNVPKYLAYGKPSHSVLDSMEIKIDWNVSAQFVRTDTPEKTVSNMTLSNVNTESANIAAKVSVSMKLSNKPELTTLDDAFKTLSDFIGSRNGLTTLKTIDTIDISTKL